MNTKKSLSELVNLSLKANGSTEYDCEFNGTIDEFVSLTGISHKDKLWVILSLLTRENIEVFAIDCSVAAASYAAAAAADAAAAAYAAAIAADADIAADYAAAAYAAAIAAADAATAYAAYVAADAAAYAAAAAAYAAAAAADTADYAAAENERQLEALIYLLNREE